MEPTFWLGMQALDAFAAFWLLLCWLGYTIFARKRARRSFCLASVLQYHRRIWMLTMLQRDIRVSDASLLSNLERNTSFLASTAIFIIAGLVTILASIEKVYAMLQAVPFAQGHISLWQLQFKVVLLLLIYIYAFFTLTWSLRQYGFCAVLVGAAPVYPAGSPVDQAGRRYAWGVSKIIDQAGHSYNYGLRAFYFSLSILAWLLNTWVFLLAVSLVVLVLYRREFHSGTLHALINAGSLRLDDVCKSQSGPDPESET